MSCYIYIYTQRNLQDEIRFWKDRNSRDLKDGIDIKRKIGEVKKPYH